MLKFLIITVIVSRNHSCYLCDAFFPRAGTNPTGSLTRSHFAMGVQSAWVIQGVVEIPLLSQMHLYLGKPLVRIGLCSCCNIHENWE